MKTYVMTDIHGSLKSLKKAISKINLKKSRLFILGDYVDRGNESMEVLEFLIENISRDYEKAGIHPLLGNHDHSLLYNLKSILKYFNESNISINAFDGNNKFSYTDYANYVKSKLSFSLYENFREASYTLGTNDLGTIVHAAEKFVPFLSSLPLLYKTKHKNTDFYLSHAALPFNNSYFNSRNAPLNLGYDIEEIDLHLGKSQKEWFEKDSRMAYSILWSRDYLFDSKIFTDYENKISIIGHTPTCVIGKNIWKRNGYVPLELKDFDNIEINEEYMPFYNKKKGCIALDTGGIFSLIDPTESYCFYSMLDLDDLKVIPIKLK